MRFGDNCQDCTGRRRERGCIGEGPGALRRGSLTSLRLERGGGGGVIDIFRAVVSTYAGFKRSEGTERDLCFNEIGLFSNWHRWALVPLECNGG
jgi:hypothetical protein